MRHPPLRDVSEILITMPLSKSGRTLQLATASAARVDTFPKHKKHKCTGLHRTWHSYVGVRALACEPSYKIPGNLHIPFTCVGCD